MVHARIATSAEQPVNRHAGLAQYAGEEAELVGVDANGDIVKADADSGVAVKARGVLMSPVTDLSAVTEEAVSLVTEANRTLMGTHRVSYIEYGVVVENSDEDWGFTPGDDVYLAAGGGYTQTMPAAVGDLQQIVGYAIDDGEAIVLRVSQQHDVAA
ncbi:hypothetical protein [Halorubellus litoreus]|uniref:Uncharacterized protein n=1 Tax=Halorubellus litoreus TaxID=755308 RepID=A0ABD5VE26_9EURY